MKVVNLAGQRFGRLVVVKRSFPNTKNGTVKWLCECDCGQVIIIQRGDLQQGRTSSCGCYHKEQVTTHGESTERTREYMSWENMKARCLKPKDSAYKNYGGRGIKICSEWLNSYEKFLADMGRCPDGLTLERLDNNGDYEASNCSWISRKEQSYNRRNNVWVEFKGKKMIKADWLRKLHISPGSWHHWLNKGLSKEEVVSHFYNKIAEPVPF